MANRLDNLEDKIDEILKAIHRLEGKVFANDSFMHKIWDEENKLKDDRQMKKAE